MEKKMKKVEEPIEKQINIISSQPQDQVSQFRSSGATPPIQVLVQMQRQQVPITSTLPRSNQIAPTQVAGSTTQRQHHKTRSQNICSTLFLVLFILHLIFIFILSIFLTTKTVISSKSSNSTKLNSIHWYPPLLTSYLSSLFFSLASLLFISHYPTLSIKTAFYIAPSLTFAASLILLSTTTDSGLCISILGIAFSLILSLYSCWVSRRRNFAAQILSLSLSAAGPTSSATLLVTTLTLLVSLVFSTLSSAGIGNAIFAGRLSTVYIIALLLSLAWTMHVARNILHVAFARRVYKRVRAVTEGITKGYLGEVCVGSVVVPLVGLWRGGGRSMRVCGGGEDEFMMSCVECWGGAAEKAAEYGNRWGWVHVGLHEKGIVKASKDTWDMFARAGMVDLIDSDLTGAVCFFYGVAGGALGAIVGSTWAFVVHKTYVTSVSLCCFFIGYFMNRIALAWPLACVSAYYVAYAENPQSPQFDYTIPNRIRALQAAQA